jgi:cytochrome c
MKLKHALAVIVLVLSFAAPLTVLVSSAFAQHTSASARRGERLVSAHCAICHAIGRSGTSPHPVAPPFRTLFQRYPLESLVESLGEGLTSGHPDMPTFVFSPGDVGAILSYLQSIQQP